MVAWEGMLDNDCCMGGGMLDNDWLHGGGGMLDNDRLHGGAGLLQLEDLQQTWRRG